MQREYVHWYSSNLGREMEMLVFGHAGTPVLVFPTSLGRFFEYEDRGMIHALSHQIETGLNQVYCVDSVDGESWYNGWAHPQGRVVRHIQYERYIIEEVLRFVQERNENRYLIVSGCSFGAYHTANLAFRHPNLVNKIICLGGSYDMHSFLDGHYDEDCYFNSPMDYLTNLTDPWYLDRYRQMKIVLATGDWDMCWDANERLSRILWSKDVPHWLDVWGNHTGHDWPWWQGMIKRYIGA